MHCCIAFLQMVTLQQWQQLADFVLYWREAALMASARVCRVEISHLRCVRPQVRESWVHLGRWKPLLTSAELVPSPWVLKKARVWWDPRFDLVGKILASLMMQIGVTQGGAHRPSGRSWGGHQHHLRQQGRAVALYGCHRSPGDKPTPVSNDNRQRVNETGPVTGVSGNTTLNRGMTTTGDEVMWSGGVLHRTGDRPAAATAVGHVSCVGVWDVRDTVKGDNRVLVRAWAVRP